MSVGQRGKAVAAVLLLAACGSEDSEPAPPSPTTTTAPAITAPPALTPEEQAEADIQTTFEQLIAAWDDFKANASDYGGTSGWNIELVGRWKVEGAANADLANWIAAWRSSEIEQVGRALVARHEVSDVKLDVTDQGIHEATSIACLDMSQLVYVEFEGGAAELPETPALYQRWHMSWTYAPMADPASGTEMPGWYVSQIEVALDEPC
ncbi:hypothetical protein E1262_18575 [Jiangella aurantiaca]|uniref:Nuclear transport factor 2 family protein n=1 Tax=Jiangella aurantiaca TaxID=2530373 RepID=A0A4R5A7N3_9ACTN|nr:hypothetical protein [Jiangella aurantiaca]TDD67655.1 hypothetical protein E1262_18575 [Jiangella aurantiaca]